MPKYRSERLGRLLQEKIGALITLGKIKDYRVDSFLTVTGVDVSGDLSFADVRVSGFKSEEALARGVKGLQSAAGFIQSQLAQMLRVRQTPRLRFHADPGIKDAFVLNRKIDALTASPMSTGTH